MAHHDVEVAVEARLRAGFNLAPLFTENLEGETPPDGSAFITVQFPVARDERWAVNERRYRQEGAFRIVISLPSASGKDLMRDWSKTLSELFLDVTFDGVVCQVPSTSTDERSREGSYFVGYVVCPFTFNYTA